MSELIETLTSTAFTTLGEIGEERLWDQLDEIARSPALPFAVELIAEAWPVPGPGPVGAAD